jgi:uncharacterized membrane protein YqhA
MKKLLLLSAALFTTFFVSAQIPSLQWVDQMGGTLSEYGNSVVTDASSNVYIAGAFNGTVDFDPSINTFNLTSVGGSDIFISKLDASGNLVWAKSMGSFGLDSAIAMVIDSSGNIFLTGYYSQTVDFDLGAGVFNLTASGFYDVFINKIDSSGNFVWAKSIGGTSADVGYSIALDGSGNIYTTGSFAVAADFDPNGGTFTLNSSGSTPDIFVSKLDASGNFVWAKAMGGSGINDYGYDIAVDVNGNVYTSGSYNVTADFDPGAGSFVLTSAGNIDIFISKLDASGNFVWAKSMGGSQDENAKSLVLDSNANVYLGGYFNGTADFDPGIGTSSFVSAGNQDAFITKLDTSGNFVWAKTIGGSNPDGVNTIFLDAVGNIYTTGWYTYSVDFDPNGTIFNLTGDFRDIFISKLDALGNFVWAKGMGSSGYDSGICVTVDTNNNVYTTGSFENTVDFNPDAGISNIISLGSADIFVHKMSQIILGLNNNSLSNNFKIYPNPTSGIFNIEINEKLIGAKASIYSLLGQKIKDFSLNSMTTNQNLTKGIYLLEIDKEGIKTSKKLIVN